MGVVVRDLVVVVIALSVLEFNRQNLKEKKTSPKFSK